MRIAFVAVMVAGLSAVVPVAAANAAVLIDASVAEMAAPAAAGSARCAAADASGAACVPAASNGRDNGAANSESLPPAAIAGIVGLLVLALTFRSRKASRKMGLPEVTS